MLERFSRNKIVPKFHNIKFLLDENVSNNLKKFLISKGYETVSVQDLDERGTKNSELMELARIKNRIFITYDKDFMYFKHKIDNFLIIIDIHPLIDENVIPAMEQYLISLKIEDLKKNYVILEKDNVKLIEKDF